MAVFGETRIISMGVLVLVLMAALLHWPSVSAQTDASDQAESTTETSPPYPKCITTCVDDKGVLPSGDYAYCDDCNAVAKCTYGTFAVIKCPLGTVYYDRLLGVCVSDSTVCINDSYVVQTPTRSVLTTAATGEEVVTSTSAITTTTTPTTAAESTTVELTSTTTTAATTTAAESTTVELTSTTTATSAAQTSQTLPQSTAPSSAAAETTTSSTSTGTTITTTTASSTTSAATTSTFRPSTPGYTAPTGPEAESLQFALDLYNKLSGQAVRAGLGRIQEVSKQSLGTNNGTWYRLVGVTLARSSCYNTGENMGADNQRCPLLDPGSAGASQSSVAECSFTVNYSDQTINRQLDMVYMMCY